MTRCYICDRGDLIDIGDNRWWCSRASCNSEFFHDTDGTLNVRDKPNFRPLRRKEPSSGTPYFFAVIGAIITGSLGAAGSRWALLFGVATMVSFTLFVVRVNRGR